LLSVADSLLLIFIKKKTIFSLSLAQNVQYTMRKYNFMKLLKPILLFIFCLLFCFPADSQDVISSIPVALKSGNAAAIAKKF
jgi:hypothetical protein